MKGKVVRLYKKNFKSCNRAASSLSYLVYQNPILPVRSAAHTRSLLFRIVPVNFAFTPITQHVSMSHKQQSLHASMPSPFSDQSIQIQSYLRCFASFLRSL